EIVPYDALQDAELQLSRLAVSPTHIYYFATPAISQRKPRLFIQNRFDQFIAFYVTGFYRLIEAALRRRPEGITVFYPSTAFVDNRPANMTEYAMSKAAGEVLCADIVKHMRKTKLIVSRLPPLLTDQ